jgi:hypothetical protein
MDTWVTQKGLPLEFGGQYVSLAEESLSLYQR